MTSLRNALMGNGQGVDDVDEIELVFDTDHKILLRGFIYDFERAVDPAIVGPILGEVLLGRLLRNHLSGSA